MIARFKCAHCGVVVIYRYITGAKRKYCKACAIKVRWDGCLVSLNHDKQWYSY